MRVACKHIMTPNYTYINSPDYINSLSFDYVETYSFQRGEDYEQNFKLLKVEYDKLKARIDQNKNLTTDEEERYEELNKLVGFTQYLIDNEGRFHPSSKKTNTFPHDHPAVERIKQILQTDIEDVPRWLCSPVYRDGLVFYDRDKRIVSALNICLSFQYMETKMFAHINGDYKTYDLFKRFFLDIGHEVEDPEYSIVAQMEQLKQKYGKL